LRLEAHAQAEPSLRELGRVLIGLPIIELDCGLDDVGTCPLGADRDAVGQGVFGAHAEVRTCSDPRLVVEVVFVVGITGLDFRGDAAVANLDAGQGRHEHRTEFVAHRNAEASAVRRVHGVRDLLVEAAVGDRTGDQRVRILDGPHGRRSFDAEDHVAQREAIAAAEAVHSALGLDVGEVVVVRRTGLGGGADDDVSAPAGPAFLRGHLADTEESHGRRSRQNRHISHELIPLKGQAPLKLE